MHSESRGVMWSLWDHTCVITIHLMINISKIVCLIAKLVNNVTKFLGHWANPIKFLSYKTTDIVLIDSELL